MTKSPKGYIINIEKGKEREDRKMTYAEMKNYIANAIANGEPLHGWARDMAIDFALEELEDEGEE